MKRTLSLLSFSLLAACSVPSQPVETLPLDEAADMQEQKPQEVMQKEPEESFPDEDLSFGKDIEGALKEEEPPKPSFPPKPLIVPEPVAEGEPEPVANPELAEPEPEQEAVVPQSHVVNMSVKSWAFSPATVTAKQGENLQIQLSGISGTHGFAIDALGINESIKPGETRAVSVPTDQPGTYEFYCTIPCGAGHKSMRGTLVIE